MAVARILYGFLGDLDVLLIGWSCLGTGVDGFCCERNLVGVMGNVSRSINSGTGYSDVIVELGSVDRGVNGYTGDTDIVSVDGGLNTSTIFLLDAVNGREVRLVVAVKLDGRLRVA